MPASLMPAPGPPNHPRQAERGQVQRIGQSAGHVPHRGGGQLVRGPPGIVHRGHHQVLEGFHVGGIDDRRVDADAPELAATRDDGGHQASTGGTGDLGLRQRCLGAFHLRLNLLGLQHDLGQVGHTGHHQQTSPRRA